MIRYVLIFACYLLGLLSAMAAATSELRGKVKDAETGDPISGAIVKAKGAFATTDKDGLFVIKLNASVDSVSFRSMGYESMTLPISSGSLEVFLLPKATQLKDVIVEAPDIFAKGDTLVFNVAKYANAKDNAIIDVIKRLPGVRVREDGTIEYQGKPINKFYIDGNDFIGGRYGLATNNISHKDVKSVEIMERHQPVKALEGIEFPEEAGINLKLKDDARSRWVGVGQAALGGEPFLYDASLFTMRMASKIQNVFTIKADNTGWNPANEIREHGFEDMFSSDYAYSLWPEYISAGIVNAPLSEKRTRDNLSWLANAIVAWKTGDNSMRLKLNYMADRLDYAAGVRTDYFSSQIPTFVQNNSIRTQSHDISVQYNSEINKRGYYLKDKLTFSGIFDRSNDKITGSAEITQLVNRKRFSAENDLKLAKRNEKKIFTLTSRNAFSYLPDRLSVRGEEDAVQSIGITDFRSSTETRFGKLTRFWKYYLTTGIDLNYHKMSSTLNGLGIFDSNGVHEAFLSNLYAVPQVDYERSQWRLSLRMPLKWQLQSVAGLHNYLCASPRLSVRKQLTSKSELSGSLYYNLGSPQPYLNIKEPILSDFRNLFIAANPDKYTQGFCCSLSYSYRNPIKSLFVNVSGSYGYLRSFLMSTQSFVDGLIISSYADCLSKNDTWKVKGGLSKGLGHSKMVVGIEWDATLSAAASMRDGKVIPYRQLSAGVKPYFKGSIVRWLSITYEAEYGLSKLNIEKDVNCYHNLHQNLFGTIMPNDYINFTLGAEHFLTRFPEGNCANLILLDASAVWRLSNKVRLSLTGTNLLNRRIYKYVNYGTLSRSEHQFYIRHRTILASVQYRF